MYEGKQTTLPLHTLAPQSQQRLRDQFKSYEITPPLQATYTVTARHLKRLTQLEARGRLTPETYNTQRQAILEGFYKTALDIPQVSGQHINEALIMLQQ